MTSGHSSVCSNKPQEHLIWNTGHVKKDYLTNARKMQILQCSPEFLCRFSVLPSLEPASKLFWCLTKLAQCRTQNMLSQLKATCVLHSGIYAEIILWETKCHQDSKYGTRFNKIGYTRCESCCHSSNKLHFSRPFSTGHHASIGNSNHKPN